MKALIFPPNSSQNHYTGFYQCFQFFYLFLPTKTLLIFRNKKLYFDLNNGKTIDIVASRKYDDLEKYFSNFENRNLVELVSMDLYSPFKRIIKDKFVKDKIVADRFHYTKLVMKSLDELRLNILRNTKGIEKIL